MVEVYPIANYAPVKSAPMLPKQRTAVTDFYFCACEKKNETAYVPKEALLQKYIKRNIYISFGNRCCKTRLVKNRLIRAN